MSGYKLLDSGEGKKWEQFGSYVLCRPCAQAVWRPQKKIQADATFSREGANRWKMQTKLPQDWTMMLEDVEMKISLTEFGHLGAFPEHANLWDWMESLIQPGDEILNLFAYSGGATLAAAKAKANVCHVDASKGMVDWARENAKINRLSDAPIRWIVDDVTKFLKREQRRDRKYEGIILDPPTFGRGAKGEVFKIEEEILPLLDLCKSLLSDTPRFILFTCHTPGFTPIVLGNLLSQVFGKKPETGEMVLMGDETPSIPSGAFARVEL